MSTVITSVTDLAHEVRGNGAPIVSLYGLTFDRGTWIRLWRGWKEFRCVTIDLPSHAEPGSAPPPG